MKIRSLLIVVAMIGVWGCSSHSEESRLDAQFGEMFDGGKSLLIAVETWRAETGEWPASPQQIHNSKRNLVIAGFDRYENLRFEPLSNGDLAISFDRWTSPRGIAAWSGGRIELAP